MIFTNIVVGNPICEPWHMFCKKESEWEEEKKNIMFTNERFLPKILVDAGIAKSNSEVRKNKPEFVKTLDTPDFLELKWGKKFIFIQVGN